MPKLIINWKTNMKAIGYTTSLPIVDEKSLVDIDLPKPVASGQDILVKISAIAVNPVDYKIRQNVPATDRTYKVIGWDAVGEVAAVGNKISQFKLGDKVYYAGDLNRQGSNAEYQLVDERIVGFKPNSLSDADAAALPLTTITAWELLFEHLSIKQQSPDAIQKTDEVILVVGAAGGVGSILLQLAKTLTGATIIATASRQSTQDWVKKLGADYVVDHTKPLQPQIEALNIDQVTHVASLNGSPKYMDTYTELLVPFGKIALIDDPGSFDITQLKTKSLSLHWEFMFARSMHKTSDMVEQHNLLTHVANEIDAGRIKTTVSEVLSPISAANMKEAHRLVETGKAKGKIVVEGF